jgi:hypothetical protein
LKRPVYPVYQLKFKGDSSYKKAFNGERDEARIKEELKFEREFKEQLKIRMRKGNVFH